MALPKGITNAVPVSGDAKITGTKTFTQTIVGTAAAAAKLATARTITLSGAASGSVSFDGSADATLEVSIGGNQGGYESECVVDKEYEFQYGYIRYSSGLQICWGWSELFGGGNGSSKTFTFAKSFKTRPHVFCSPCNGAYKWSSYNAETSSTTTTGTIKIWVIYGSADAEASVAFNWIAIGWWKFFE